MKRQNKWKKLYSCVLAVCLIGTLVLSNQSFGVFAEKTEEETTTEQTTEQEKNTVESAEEKGMTEVEKTTETASKNKTTLIKKSTSTKSKMIAMQNTAWTVEKGVVSVSGNGNKPSSISVETSKKRLEYTGNKDIVFGYKISSNDTISGSLNITITDCGIMSDDDSVEIWKVTSDGCEKLNSQVLRSEGKISFATDSMGEYLAVSNVATVDLTKGEVTVTEDTLKGTQQDGTNTSISFSAEKGKKYRISQSDQNNRCKNKIEFLTSKNYSSERTLILDGINTSSDIEIPAEDHTVIAKLLLRNQNQVHRVYYGTGSSNLMRDANQNSKLTIDNYSDSSESMGELYVPYKMNTKEERNYVLTKVTSGIGENWSQAGIGGGRDKEKKSCTGLTIAGGKIRVLVQNKNGATAIGGGGNADAQISITGGDITAICSSTGAAIGGGIGWVNRGGVADISITGGNIYAENMDQYTRDVDGTSYSYGGVAIGSGSSMQENGNEAKIKISGGSVTAYARYGNGIGSGNSYRGTAAKAAISISGDANVTTNALGGGTSKENIGGDADITVADSAIVNCEKYSEISDKWDTNNQNILGAFGIGGGNSAGTAKGGSAIVNVSGGTLNCNGGNIGGGEANGTGDGGDASIAISGGKLDCASIGGGNSNSGTPGSVTSSDQKAGVVVTGGTLKAGTIGGGTNDKGDIGFATANISGGNIQGQFILSNTDPNKQCKFTMTGGTIDNTNLGTDKYQKAQKNGGAVYLSDPKGEVSISGGTIENSKAELGGAVYMTTGSFTLSGDATIQNCKATGNDSTSAQGGAVYLDDGTVTMKGGCILSSSAKQGGAVYLNKGTVTLSNGTIGKDNSPNSATEGAGVYIAGGTLSLDGGSIMYNTADNGAGAYLKDGSMKISNGQILHNTSKEDGGGAYLAGGTLDISSGIITENVATQNGGGVYLNNGNMTLSGGRIYSNKSVNGAGAYLHGGNLNVSGGGDFDSNIASKDGGGAYLAGGALTVNSGTFNKNTATQNGGGAYLAGGTLTINGGAFDHNTAMNGAGAYAADGKVRMFGGNITNNKAQQNGGGFYVSSNEKPADVLIRSGKLTNNTAGNSTTDDQGNGGAIAVVSHNTTNADHVIIGLRHKHDDLDIKTRTFTTFKYNDDKDENKEHEHESCPEIISNQASGNGGGIYMNSTKSILDIYCLIEEKNTATKDTTGGSIMSEGGTVNIGDIGDNNQGNNTANAVGNIYIQSPMLVKGGDVKIYGNTDNPKFADKILVNIQEHAGSFNDYRYTNIAEGESRNYKIEYFENFQGSGTYIAEQYTENDEITAIGNMYKHEGYKIVGWNTKENGSETVGKMYNTGDLIGSENDHTAWDGKDATEALKLYAIWEKISYTVQYEPNADHYSGQMSSETFKYGERHALTKNNYKVTGKRFVKWNTEKDGSGTEYNETYDESKMIDSDGATVHLYAQWANCTHKNGDNPGKLSYTPDKNNHIITETCDCGGHTATIQISGADVYYDGKDHPASLNRTGDFLESSNTITYAYKGTLNESYGAESTTQPREVGYYRAILTVQGQKVSIEYQIKSPADAAQIDVAAISGQHFIDFNGNQECTVAQDDAFTVQYNVQGLNQGTNNGQKAYEKAPVVTLTKALPTGTTIIMQTEKSYWYLNNPTGKEIQLSAFKKMGTQDTTFSYNTSNIQDAQKYRFIIDFSDVKEDFYLNGELQIGLKYEYTGSEQGDSTVSNDKEQKATISIGDASKFAVTTSLGNKTGKITAPSDTTNTKWERKNLVWKITTTDSTTKLPSDAKLTLSTTVDGEVKTAIYTQNAKGEFIIPFAWTGSQDFTFALSSDQESVSNKSYDLTAALCIGSKQDTTQQLQVIAIEDGMEKALLKIQLTIPVTTSPALKISGNQCRVLTKSDQLKVGINYKNVEGCSIQAVIQKKNDGTYQGEYYKGSISTEGSHNFTLGSTDGPGSYRLLVKVSAATGQTLLEVPYYFIVQ